MLSEYSRSLLLNKNQYNLFRPELGDVNIFFINTKDWVCKYTKNPTV